MSAIGMFDPDAPEPGVDRLSPGYEPRFDIDYALGHQGELYVQDIVRSLGTDRIEVKTDERAMQTGRVFVEYQCKKLGGWASSGIATTQAEFWAFVVGGDTIVVCPMWRLKDAARRVWKSQPGLRVECVRGSHPTRGVAIPLKWLFAELYKDAA